jgi:hypothetical protein
MIPAAFLLAAAEARLARLDVELAAEDARIADAVAAKTIGDGTGYWKRRHELAQRLRVAHGLVEALRP